MNFKKIAALTLSSVLAFSLSSPASARLMGDINNDGNVNASDALAVLKYAVGAETSMDSRYADMNCDNVINSSDALAILRVSVGSDAPVEAPENSTDFDIPETQEGFLALYNDAVNNAVEKKAGYTKERTTTVSHLDAGSYTSMAGDIVKEFLGEGTNELKNTKGKAKHLKKSTLEISDISKIEFELYSTNYSLTLYLNDGTSSASKSSTEDNSPLRKCGLITGTAVTTDVDYINSKCIYESVIDKGVSVNKVSATTSNAKIVIVVDRKTGNIISYTASFDWDASIQNLSVTFPPVKISKATGKAHTTIELSDFKW